MEVRPVEGLPEVLVIEPVVHRDGRGFFLETYHEGRYAEAGVAGPFLQDNHARSGAGVLRGLHAQARRPQGKLLRCVEGAVWDVAVDIRPGSPTYRRWAGLTLSAENHLQLWIPPGFAHGYCVLGEAAGLVYKCTEVYSPGDEIGIRWDDPDLAIQWPVHEPVLSEKDRTAPLLREIEKSLAPYAPAGG